MFAMNRRRFEGNRRIRLVATMRHKPVAAGLLDGQRNGNPATHGGLVSDAFICFAYESKKLMNLNDKKMDVYSYVDVGSAHGNTCMVVSARSSHGRNVIGIENDEERFNLGLEWIANTHKEFRELPFATRHMFPHLFRADFTEEPVPALAHALVHRKIVFFCNNYGNTWAGETQVGLESRIGGAKTGSIMISLGRSFLHNPYWHEEVFETMVQRRHISWFSGGANQSEEKSLLIFKYTKRDVPGRAKSRRFVTVWLPFPAHYNTWPGI